MNLISCSKKGKEGSKLTAIHNEFQVTETKI